VNRRGALSLDPGRLKPVPARLSLSRSSKENEFAAASPELRRLCPARAVSMTINDRLGGQAR
jgi:hypothetical protein